MDTLTKEDSELILALAPEITKSTSGIFVDRADSPKRWFAWPASVAMLNRKGQIDSTQLYDNLIRNIQKLDNWPFLTIFHLGNKAKVGQTDFVARSGYAYLMSGTFDDTPLAASVARSLAADKDHYWGTSIRFYPLGAQEVLRWNDQDILVYNNGIQEEVSILPSHLACSYQTNIPVTVQ